jgi:hypothetical protein
MQNSDPELSEAVVLFLGYGIDSTPARHSAKLVERFGAQRAAILQAQVNALRSEIGSIHIDWKLHTLVTGSDFAQAHMKVHHPELSKEALNALSWEFSWDWR